MEVLHHLSAGFEVALTPINILYCWVGALLGTVVGVIPGLGPVTTIAMLLPITFKMPAVSSLIMLSGIYYGAHHAGATGAVMLNMPGDPTAIVVCLDGHPMAKKGRAGPALAATAFASFFAGCVSILVLAVLTPPLTQLALHFQSAEYAATIVLALVSVSVISSALPVTTVSMAVLGLLLGSIGTDLDSGVERLTMGLPNLSDGINIIALVVGLFAFAQIIPYLTHKLPPQMAPSKITGLLPNRDEWRRMWRPILRGTGLGSILGIFPGTGPLIASFAAYTMERYIAKDPSRFGHGAIEGVAGPEAANNASAMTHFIPMLTLGIPAGPAMALLLAALMIQGVSPGPEFIHQHATLFWGVIASMWIGNFMLLFLNLPLIGLWVRLLTIPYRYLYPFVLFSCCVGIYAINNQAADVIMAAIIGLFGVLFRWIHCPPEPLVLGFILEPVLEDNFRRAMLIARGDPLIFIERPVSLFILLLSLGLLVLFSLPSARRRVSRAAHVTEG